MESTRRNPPSRSDAAYQAIKSRILDGRLRPGEALVLERFEKELHLSRTPVREALRRLSEEGFIQIRPRIGTFVALRDPRALEEMFDICGVLEAHAARLAAPRIPPPRLASLEQHLRNLRTTGAIDCVAITQGGLMLHHMIAYYSGNQTLLKLVRSIHEHFVFLDKELAGFSDLVLSCHWEHIEVVNALKQRDGERAERLMRSHFEHAGRRLFVNLAAEYLNNPEARQEPQADARAALRSAS